MAKKHHVKPTLMQLFTTLMALALSLISHTVYAATAYDQQYLVWKNKHATALPHSSMQAVASPTRAAKSPPDLSSNTTAKISINQASAAELQQLKGVGEKKAQAIIRYREQNGRFNQISELQNVKGIGAKFIEKNRDQLTL